MCEDSDEDETIQQSLITMDTRHNELSHKTVTQKDSFLSAIASL